ncbi:MAG: hypothetical protein AAF702_32720 [Chloroflexota bacterium]
MSSRTLVSQSHSSLRERPEQMAWTILLGSFSIFCLLAFAIPNGFSYFYEHGTLRQSARLDPTLGTLFFRALPNAERIAITESRDSVREGSIIEAGSEATQGTVTFISDEEDELVIFGSIQLYRNTTVEMERIRKPIFSGSTQPYLVRMAIQQGQTRIFNNSDTQRALRVELKTPHGLAIMDMAGAYKVQVTEERTDITVRTGLALLMDEQGNTVAIAEPQRAWVSAEELAEASSFEEQNLIRNGEFQKMADGTIPPWAPYSTSENEVNPGTLQYITSEGRQVLFFSRQTGDDYHTEVGVIQSIDQQVNVYDSLILQFDVKALNQNLAGGGQQGTEFPLRVELTYTDIYGKVQTWGQGFYYLDPRTDAVTHNDKWSLANSQLVPQGQWYSHFTPNLIPIFVDRGTPPDTIDRIRIYASGHKYQSIVSSIDLLAE